jgi:hypothetical protein
MSLKGQSWIATILLTLGLLGVVASMSMKILRGIAWPSLALIVAGLAGFVLVVRNLSRQMAGQSSHVDSMLAEAARVAALKRAQDGDSGKKPAP